MTKPVCLHFHIFKNAGSTINWILKKNFSNNWLSLDTSAHKGILHFDKVLNYLKKHSDVKAFSSHQIRFPLPQNSGFHFIPIVFIRHPIIRAFSIYRFDKNSTGNFAHQIKARNSSLEEYLEWNFDKKNNVVMTDFQVLFLSHTDNKPNITKQDFELAIERIGTCPILGIVEKMDQSLVLAEEVLHSFFKNIDLSYISQNVSKEIVEDINERIEMEKKLVADDIMKKLVFHNKLDMKLYEYANEELDRRIKRTENFEKKLSDFRDRCRKLEGSLIA